MRLKKAKVQSVKNKTNIIQREKKLLSFIRHAFAQQSSADDIRTFALEIEREWKADGRFSPQSIEVMLKLAKTEILSRLKDRKAVLSPDTANFMAKNRTTHYFFCMPFQLTMFSTSSTKAYNLYTSVPKFEAAVQKEVERCDREFNAVMV